MTTDNRTETRPHAEASVHETAIVEPGATIGLRSRVWHHSHVRSGAIIGSDCVLGKNVFVDSAAVIGNGCKVQNNVSVYNGVELADDVFVGPSVTFTNDLHPRANGDWNVSLTRVRTGASIGANATIVCGIELGEHCLIAAGSVVTRSVDPHQLVMGNPARPAGWVCACGETISRSAERPPRLACARHRPPVDPSAALEPIAVSSIHIGREEETLVLQVIRSGRLAQGPMVERLENEFAAKHGVRHAIAVNNGTTALVAAIQALHLAPGDEIITSPFSFVATLNAILEAGAVARFADIDDNFCLDPASVEPLVNERTRAVMPVHLYGLVAEMHGIENIARRHGLHIIEDAAQAHGAKIDERFAGSFGTGCFSLYATKNIMAGEGGIITTDNDETADWLRLARSQGMRARYQYEIAGHNYRMTEMQAAIAVAQLDRLDALNERRRENAAALTAGLADVPGIVVPTTPAGRLHSFHQYTVRVTGERGIDRDQLATRLEHERIGTGVYYPRLMHDYDCYRTIDAVRPDVTPRAATIATQALSLPVHPALRPADIDRITSAVRKIMDS